MLRSVNDWRQWLRRFLVIRSLGVCGRQGKSDADVTQPQRSEAKMDVAGIAACPASLNAIQKRQPRPPWTREESGVRPVSR